MIHLTLCTGLRRSASTWSYNVARLLMEGVARSRKAHFRANYSDGEHLDSLLHWAAKNSSGFFVIKSHLPGPFARKVIAAGKARNIVTYRDPRDVVVSLRDFKGWSIEDGIRAVLHEMPYIEAFWHLPSSLLLRYEDTTEDPRRGIKVIADFLQVGVDEAGVERVHEKTSAEAHHSLVESLPNLGEGDVRQEEDHLVHREQLLHTGHVRDGQIGKWRDRLSAPDQRLVCDELRAAIQMMGYPAD